MMKYITGDILMSQAEAIVNPVNCIGVMGAGLAKQMRKSYPHVFAEYAHLCNCNIIRLGRIFPHSIPSGPPHVIISFPTKYHWKDASTLEAIESGMEALRFLAYYMGLASIALPLVGCGLGGLDWNDVKPIIEQYFSDWPGVVVYE